MSFDTGYKFVPASTDRLDILCGHNFNYPQFPCEICKKMECRGESEECKGEGAWSHGLSVGELK